MTVEKTWNVYGTKKSEGEDLTEDEKEVPNRGCDGKYFRKG